MGDQAGGSTRFRGPGSQWKSSWKGRAAFSELCCFQNLTRDAAGRYYEEPGGALDIVVGTGTWLAFLVTIESPLPDGVDVYIARNGAAPEGWELVANRELIDGVEEGVSFTFRLFNGATVAGERTGTTISLAPLIGTLVDAISFRINAFFFPPFGGFVDGRFSIAYEGSIVSTVPMLSPYSNAAPDLLLGIGNAGLEQDLTGIGSVCGIAGGEGDYLALQFAAHQQWIEDVAVVPQIVAVPQTVGGSSVPGYTADNGWRGNLPYLPRGVAPDPLAPFIGATDLVQAGGTGDVLVACDTAPFSADLLD